MMGTSTITSRAEMGEVTFNESVRAIVDDPQLDATLMSDPHLEHRLVSEAEAIAEWAYPRGRVTRRQSDDWIDHTARDAHHRALSAIYQQHLALPQQRAVHNAYHPLICRIMRILESAWEKDMLARVHARYALADVGRLDAEAFRKWFTVAANKHEVKGHDLYSLLERQADQHQIRQFLEFESAGEAAFDDLVALGQVGTRGEVKLEMGQNYWDELGNGESVAVHTHLFHVLVEGLRLRPPGTDQLPWQVVAGVNVMVWSCLSRRNAFRSQGTLGVVELLAPERCRRVVRGAVRAGIPEETMIYYAAHSEIDVGHSKRWLNHVIRAQVASTPNAAVGIAEGMLSRLDTSLDYFDYVLAHLQLQN